MSTTIGNKSPHTWVYFFILILIVLEHNKSKSSLKTPFQHFKILILTSWLVIICLLHFTSYFCFKFLCFVWKIGGRGWINTLCRAKEQIQKHISGNARQREISNRTYQFTLIGKNTYKKKVLQKRIFYCMSIYVIQQ